MKLGSAILLFLLVACESAPKRPVAAEAKAPVAEGAGSLTVVSTGAIPTPAARTTWYKYESLANGEWWKSEANKVEAAGFTELTRRAFQTAGYQMGDDKAEQVIRVQHNVIEPALFNIGILNGYTHVLLVEVYKGDVRLWSAKISCSSEYKDPNKTIAQLLAVATRIAGTSSSGEKKLSMLENDRRVLEIIGQ